MNIDDEWCYKPMFAVTALATFLGHKDSKEVIRCILKSRHILSGIDIQNKLLAIRPSPVIDFCTKNEPFLYIGLDDQSYDVLQKRVGIKKAYEIYLSFLKMFSINFILI